MVDLSLGDKVAPSKGIQLKQSWILDVHTVDSGFPVMDFGFFVSESCFPDSNL